MYHRFHCKFFLFSFLISTAYSTGSQQTNSVGIAMTPNVSLAGKYNDNIFTQRSGAGRKSDYVTILSPNMTFKAINTLHILNLNLGLSRNEYSHYWQDSFTDYNALLNGRRVFNKDMYWNASGGYRYLHSTRGNNQADPTGNAKSALPYHEYTAKTSFYKRIDKFVMLPRVGFVNYQYENVYRLSGDVLDQGGRNRKEYIYGGELGYGLPYNLNLFTDVEFNKYDYSRKNSINRDSRGYAYLFGVQYRPNSDLLARFGGGYMYRTWNKKDIYKNVGSWNASARLDWQFNKAGKINYTLRRSIDEVTNKNTSAAVRTDMKIAISYLLPSDILGTIGYRYAVYNHKGGLGATDGASDRRDNLYEGTVDLAYKCHEYVTLNANYTYTDYKSNSYSSNYKRNIVMIGAKFGV